MKECDECFLFPDPLDLSVDGVSDSDVEALDWEFVLDVVSPFLVLSEDSRNGGIYVVFVGVQPLEKFFLVVFCYFLADTDPFVDKIVHPTK